MSTMYITEFPDVGRSVGPIAVAAQPGLDQTPVTFTGTAGQSAAFRSDTKLVRVHVDGIASVLFGTNPTAVANTNMRLAANSTEYFYLQLPAQGKSFKVSAVVST